MQGFLPPYRATLVSVLLSRTKVIYGRAGSVYLSAPETACTEITQAGSFVAHQLFPAGEKRWVLFLSHWAASCFGKNNREGARGVAV